MNHFKSLLLIFLLIALLTSACGQFSQSKKESSPIIIGYSPWPGWASINIADQKGFFEAEGVKVQVVYYDSYAASLESLAAGKIDAVGTTIGDVITITANQTPLELVWVTDSPTTAEALVSRRGLTDPADLQGKRVAFESGTYAPLLISEMLKKSGLTLSDIVPVELSPDQIPAALKAGEIDAGHVWEPYTTQAVVGGANILLTAQDAPGVVMDVLAFRAEVINQRPDDVRAVVRALSKAVDYWQQNPADGNVISAQANSLPESNIAQVLAGIHVFALQDNRLLFDPNSGDVRTLHETGRLYVEFFLAQGSITQSPDLNSIINPSFVQG
jgi:NitT/TauT family transport system substrate-binding protein